MSRVRSNKPIPCLVATSNVVEAYVVPANGGPGLDDALDGIALGDKLAALRLADGPVPSVAIIADGTVPCSLLSYLERQGVLRITTVPFALQMRLHENSRSTIVDPIDRIVPASDPAFRTWAESKIRIVVSRVKTDRRGAYSLCGATLASCVSQGGLDSLLDRYPAHCAIVVDPAHDTPAVVSKHPLLADWVGSILMGRDPYSAPANAAWFRKGLLPRTYRIHGDMSPVISWRNPPALTRDLPNAACGDPVVLSFEKQTADAAGAWVDYVTSMLETFLPTPEMETFGEAFQGEPRSVRSWWEILACRIGPAVSPESMGEIIEALFKGLGLFISIHPVLQEDVQTLQAGYLLTTADGRMTVTAEFANGRLWAKRTNSRPVNVTLIFKDTSTILRLLTSPKPDLLNAMLKQQIAFDGNLNYLLKLAHLLRRVFLITKGELGSDA
jgi:hypothetical protein